MVISDGERRKALGDIEVKEIKPRQRPRFPSEENRIKATWDVSPELRDRIRAKAKELGVDQYKLVAKILADGMDRIDAGEWELKRVPVDVKYDLE